jgi:NAD(P)-dependent dehydrogenase (short-subunit alcohol dehydrogenase family)
VKTIHHVSEIAAPREDVYAAGIGLATARLFAERGANVAAHGRDDDKVSRATAELGGASIGIVGDVTKVEDIERLMRSAADAFGGIDVVVANAGIGRFAPIEDVSPDEFDLMCAVHLRGAFFTVQKALPYMGDGLTDTPMAGGDPGVPAEVRDAAARIRSS